MRAREPDECGVVERGGVPIAWERFGDGPTTVALVPTWSIIPSRFWKLQVPALARRHRVITFDGRGTGRSGVPTEVADYTIQEFAADTVAVLDATGTESAVLVSLSRGTLWALQVAADHPERVLGVVAIGTAADLAPQHAARRRHDFEEALGTDEGWAKFNAPYWRRDYRGFLEFFFGRMFGEPHSTKPIEDCVGWGLETTPEVLAQTQRAVADGGGPGFRDLCAGITRPVLVIHGEDDAIRPHAAGAELARLTRGSLVTVVGGGHGPQTRDPVFVNRLIEEFVDSVAPRPVERRWVRAARRPKRALYLSSPIGLGHAMRDVAIAGELRRHHPDLQIDWLAQHPVTAVLEAAGESVHPGSRFLASESGHIEDEAHEHDLHAFQAVRRMDEILVNNFGVFRDVVEGEHYDLVIGDEAWEVDHLLHENPELKRFSFAWLTDFVGWLPMPEGGAAEAALTADYNAEMIEQRARYKRVRDRSVFVGEPDDIVPDTFGPDLPAIRDWTEEHFAFAGYVTGFDPIDDEAREALREELGYRPDERVCVVTVGGSGVGGSLLRRAVDAIPQLHREHDDLRFVVVAGPRIDPDALPQLPGVEYHRFVPRLYRHLAVCDVAIVQGGLTTCMELVANRRPFVYVPLQRHFEQQFHVPHRLRRHRAGWRLDYCDAVEPEALAAAVTGALTSPIDYLPVGSGGAARAAGLLAELV